MRTVTREFNNIGEKVTIQLKYSDLEISKLPDNCNDCPIGFMHQECGKEYPISEIRPKTCKLKLIDLDKIWTVEEYMNSVFDIQKAYNKAIDDFVEELKDYFVIPHDVRVIEIKAKQLKVGDEEWDWLMRIN